MGPKNTGRGIESEDMGPAGWDPSRVPRARLGQAWHAGDTRPGTPHPPKLPKLRPPIFNDLRDMTSLSIRFDSYWEWAAHRGPRPSFHFWA